MDYFAPNRMTGAVAEENFLVVKKPGADVLAEGVPYCFEKPGWKENGNYQNQ